MLKIYFYTYYMRKKILVANIDLCTFYIQSIQCLIKSLLVFVEDIYIHRGPEIFGGIWEL